MKIMRGFPGGLVVRIRAFTAVSRVQSLVRELRSCKPQGVAKKKKERERIIYTSNKAS